MNRLLSSSHTLSLRLLLSLALTAPGVLSPALGSAQSKAAAETAPDTLVLSNGDTLHGKLVNEIDGKVTFHSEPLGDLTIGWDNIKELHATHPFAVVDKNVKFHGRHQTDHEHVPIGPLDMTDHSIAVHTEAPAQKGPIATKDALYIVDQPTLDKHMYHEPNFFAGWNGSATAGATLVTATQNQYTVAGSVGLIRTVPTVSWLTTKNRTSADFSGSYGKITQPAYVSGGVAFPSTSTKTAIYHIDGERDEYLSSRFFGLGQVAYDHNFAQDLQLQQIYGGGMGWTALKTANQEGDLKATVQYEKQQFISGSSGTSQNLIGSTFSATYLLHLKLVNFTQNVAFIPAYNTPRAYSTSETDTFAFPAYKRLSFTVGTIDTYLNDPPISVPPTKRNSFQFTMGFTYAFKSGY